MQISWSGANGVDDSTCFSLAVTSAPTPAALSRDQRKPGTPTYVRMAAAVGWRVESSRFLSKCRESLLDIRAKKEKSRAALLRSFPRFFVAFPVRLPGNMSVWLG